MLLNLINHIIHNNIWNSYHKSIKPKIKGCGPKIRFTPQETASYIIAFKFIIDHNNDIGNDEKCHLKYGLTTQLIVRCYIKYLISYLF